MARENTTAPPKGPEAFTNDSDVYAQAQAAILLGMAVQLRGDQLKEDARASAVGEEAPVLESVPGAEAEDEFPLPQLRPSAERVPFESSQDITESVAAISVESAGAEPQARTALAERAFGDPTPENAAALIHASLFHPDPLVRVAAAAAALPVTTEIETAMNVLREGTQSDDELVREVAATALARYAPEDDALRAVRGPNESPALEGVELEAPMGPARIIIHGTWATNNAWWQPGGDFYEFIKAGTWPDVYGAADRYRWSGGYSDHARALGGKQLAAWAQTHGGNGLSLLAHSHGASVAMLATWDPSGITFDKLRFLSSPVHPAKYKVNFARVGSVSCVRVKFDLVLLADGSGSRFTDPRYDDQTLPIWFNHSATHDPAVWTKHGVAAKLKLP